MHRIDELNMFVFGKYYGISHHLVKYYLVIWFVREIE